MCALLSKAAYVPRSIFRKKTPAAPEPPAPPPPPPPAEGEDTVEELREKLKEFVETIMAVLRPYTDAYQAVLKCCRQHSTVPKRYTKELGHVARERDIGKPVRYQRLPVKGA